MGVNLLAFFFSEKKKKKQTDVSGVNKTNPSLYNRDRRRGQGNA